MLIYKATFSNGKSYIGLTINNFELRRKQHLSESFNSNCQLYNTYFHRAIRKHGEKNIQWEILENNIIDFEYLKERETFNILKYDTYFPNGYNMTLGGEGTIGFICSDELRRKRKENALNRFKKEKHPNYGKSPSLDTREKMSKSGKGRIFSIKHKKNLSKALIGNKRWLGKKHTKETIEKMKNSSKCKIVKCKYCNKEFLGTKISLFCSCNCRSSFYYHQRRNNICSR